MDILSDRVEPSMPFLSCHIEIIKPGVATRRNPPKQKIWLLIVCCRYSQAVFVDCLLECTTAVVIIGLRKLQTYYSMPKVITSDRGTNFLGAKRVLEEMVEMGSHQFEWRLVPTGDHNFVGTVERQVALAKRILNQKLAGAVVSFNEMLVLTAKTARILNSKPMTYQTAGEDVDTWSIITPLLGGRDVEGLCSLETKAEDKITRGLKCVEEISRQFWETYRQKLLPELLKSTKWRKEQNLLSPGDIVLVENSTEMLRRHRIGQVVEIRPGGRSTVVKYKLSDDVASSDHEVSTRRLFKVDFPQDT